MDESRRTFLKVAGVAVLGGVGAPVLTALAREQRLAADPTTRLAMVIDVKRCLRSEGCKACVTACHRTHNVPDLSRKELALAPEELVRREVKWIWRESFDHAFLGDEHEYVMDALKEKDVPVFCNHCANPPCVRVCPTRATWKRTSDGLVMMDMHRCIGCRYCVVACPYGSRSFNWSDPRQYLVQAEINPDYPTRMRGVVEKCNFCEERLAEGQLPACVQACPNRAMAFGNVADETSEVRRLLRSSYSIRRRPSLGTNPQIYYLV